MCNALDEKLLSLRSRILQELEDEEPKPGTIRLGNPQTRRIIKKWKYRTKKGVHRSVRNRFLPESLCNSELELLYDNVMEDVAKRYRGVDFYSLEQMLMRLRRIVEGTKSTSLAWDSKWINPLSLASKGWEFDLLSESTTLVLKCRYCNSRIPLDLRAVDRKEDKQQQQMISKKYWELFVLGSHYESCPWNSNHFDVREYDLEDFNIVQDLQRLEQCNLIKFKYDASELANLKIVPLLPEGDMRRLADFFYCTDNVKLGLMLRGYGPLNATSGAVRCTRCFCSAFINSLLRDHLNCHHFWCRYRDEKKLPAMILSLLNFQVKLKDSKSKLVELERYLEDLSPPN